MTSVSRDNFMWWSCNTGAISTIPSCSLMMPGMVMPTPSRRSLENPKRSRNSSSFLAYTIRYSGVLLKGYSNFSYASSSAFRLMAIKRICFGESSIPTEKYTFLFKVINRAFLPPVDSSAPASVRIFSSKSSLRFCVTVGRLICSRLAISCFVSGPSAS